MIRILIADDHAIVRSGLRHIVEEEGDMKVTGEAGNAAQVFQLLRTGTWDVLVLDINLPDRSGLEVLSDVRERYPQLPVLVLSVHSEQQFAVRAFKSGAAGYLAKDSAPSELVRAIRKVCSGGRYVSEAIAELLVGSLSQTDDRPLHERLSEREFQILCLLGAGKTVGQIAEQLILSVKTVSTYRTRILEKLGLRTTAELMQYAIRHGLAS